MPLLFIIIPLVELYFILVVGGAIGALWTVILVILTAIIGVNLLRVQGMKTLAKAQRNMAMGQIPAMEMMEGLALAVAGVLLITPGFITDAIGFLCLIPASRKVIIVYLMKRSRVQSNFTAGQGSWSGESHANPKQSSDTEAPKVGRTLEGEYKRED